MKLITNIGKIYGYYTTSPYFKRGKDMSIVGTLNSAYILIEDDKIVDVGSMNQVPSIDATIIDADNGLVFPTWCDSHTHIVFAHSREGEYIDRIWGKSYEEIAANGGGILNSAHRLQAMSEDELFSRSLERLNFVQSKGTGAIEIKSGYGLTTDSEVKMLKVIKRLKSASNVKIKSTFLGAHAIPIAYKNNRQEYIDLIIKEMIPKVVEAQLADYCDVFCDQGFFTIEETDTICKVASRMGLGIKLHANELANSGGVQVGIKNNAISVDHLERIDQAEIDALKFSKTIPTLLPSCSFFLNIPYAPARKLIEAGLGFALATDYNPGTSPSGNIPMLMAIACNNMRITPSEAFNAVTINGAYAMEVDKELGSITPGKQANIIITHSIPSLDYMVYDFGRDHIKSVMIAGQFI